MNKINVLGINVKCNNKREESLINILKRDVKNFYSSYKNKPCSIDDAYNNLFGKMSCLYFLELISFKDYEKMTDSLFKNLQYLLESFKKVERLRLQKKQQKIINNNFPSRWAVKSEKGKNMKLLIQVTAFLLILLSWIFLLILL